MEPLFTASSAILQTAVRLFHVPLDNHAAVMTAEAERGAGTGVDTSFNALVRHIVEIAAVLNVRLVKVDRRREKSLVDRFYAEQRFDNARCTDHMSRHTLRRRQLHFICMLAERE